MRVAEVGLRSIASKVKVSLKDKGKRQPVEFATWDKVIQGINAKIATARTSFPQGRQKSKKLQFYSVAAAQSIYIRDLWPTHVSHTRKRYNQNETLAGMGQR